MNAPSDARPVTDMLGRTLLVPQVPQRVISLCPSQTETLLELGLDRRLVGRTRYCIHPGEQVKPITEVGGTKRVDLNVIAQLQPDLIIAEKEENPREMVESLSQIAPVFVTDVVDVASAYEMISRLAELIGKPEQGMSLQREIQNEWSHMIADAPSKRVAYLIWRKPWMAAGPQTYINSLLKTAGWINVCADPHAPSASRYPEISLELLAEKKVDYVLLSSEPYPFQEKHLSEVKSALPQARVLLTDGEPWSWYGSRMRRFPALLKSLHESLANRA